MADWSIYSSELIYAYLHGFHPQPSPWVAADPEPSPWRAADPQPSPWHSAELRVAASLLSAVSLKSAAAGLPDGPQKGELESGLDASIAEIIDDYCGTPHPHFGLAAGLSFLAGTLAQGEVQNGVRELAALVLKKTMKAQPPEPPGTRHTAGRSS
jgi:hypothetical protein